MKKKIRKIGMLSSIALMICLGVTGCYPDGKVSLEEKKETDSNQINIDENASHIEGKLDEGLFVNAQTDIKSDADWHDNNVILKSWDVDKVSNVFGNGRNISENKTMPNMHNDNLNDNYIYWDDGSSIVIQNGNLQYNTKTELEYSYLGYLYGTMPYLTDETTEKFPETEISGIDKEAAIEQVKSILDEIGVEVSKPRVYSLTYEKLEENTDYSQTDPNGNAPHQWTKEDAAYAIVFKGTIDTLPITEVGYRSGPAAGERIVGIVGKQGLIAFHALNIYELETENELSDEILTTQTVLENIQQKFRNIMITDKVEQLYTELKKIPDLTKLLGNDGEDIYPIYPQEAMFLTKFSNRNHVVDMSCGVIENDKIIITDGPLMNLEGYITKIDRHKRIAYVDVELLGKITRVQVGLEIISKT